MFNDYDMMLFDKVIAYDHLTQKISVIVNMKTDRVMENYGKAAADIQNIINIIRTAPAPEIPVSSSKVNFTCNVTQEEYCKLVEKTKEYIIDGDIFQAVISRQFSTPYEGSLINPYRVLRTTNPSPYMVYLSIDGEEIMSLLPGNAGPSGKWPPDYIPGSRFQTERHNTGGGQGSGKGSAFRRKRTFRTQYARRSRQK